MGLWPMGLGWTTLVCPRHVHPAVSFTQPVVCSAGRIWIISPLSISFFSWFKFYSFNLKILNNMIVGIILEKKKKEKALVNGWYHYDEEKIYHVANYIIPPLLREKFIGSNKQHKPRTMLANTKEIKKKYKDNQTHTSVCLSLSLSLSTGLCRLT